MNDLEARTFEGLTAVWTELLLVFHCKSAIPNPVMLFALTAREKTFEL